MFRNILKVVTPAVACLLAVPERSPAREIPQITPQDIVKAMHEPVPPTFEWTMGRLWELDQQFFTNSWRMRGNIGPLQGEYVFLTAPAAHQPNPYLSESWLATLIPRWYWRNAVPVELRRDADIDRQRPFSLLRPATDESPEGPANPFGIYDAPYGYDLPYGHQVPNEYDDYLVPDTRPTWR